MLGKALDFRVIVAIFLFVSKIQTSEIRNIKSDVNSILNISDREEQNEQFLSLLNQHPSLISTADSPGLGYGSHQTLAHFLAINGYFNLLNIMIEHGETGLVKTEKSSNAYFRNLGSTAFLALCFNIRFVMQDEESNQSFLSAIKNFLSNNPSVAVEPRSDGMTPAIAVASSRSALKYETLKLLISFNPESFEGKTSEGNFVEDVLVKTYSTDVSARSLELILEKKKNHLNFANKLQQLRQVCKGFTQSRYIPVIDKYLNPLRNIESFSVLPTIDQSQQVLQTDQLNNVRQNRPYTVSLAGSRLNEADECLCCQNGCNCCTVPNMNLHTEFWKNFYEKNPTHPVATEWFRRYRQLVQPVDINNFW